MNSPALSKLTVLIVDETQPSSSELEQELNRCEEFRVVGVANRVIAAMDLYFKHRPDVVLVSICLPDGSGFDVLDCVQRSDPACAVILMTRYPNPFVTHSGRLLGARGITARSLGVAPIRELLRDLKPANRPESCDCCAG
jgi:DNA-binding NarL/FixJ family response regulator